MKSLLFQLCAFAAGNKVERLSLDYEELIDHHLDHHQPIFSMFQDYEKTFCAGWARNLVCLRLWKPEESLNMLTVCRNEQIKRKKKVHGENPG